MEGRPRSASIRRLPEALAATLAVVGLPIAAVSLLRSVGLISGLLPLIAAGVGLSLATSYVGGAIWARRRGAGDTVFADLMLWGWLRRWRAERQLVSVVRMLGLRESRGDQPLELSTDRRVRLLAQLAASLEARSPETHGHSRRVARHAVAIAKRMGLPPEEVARIRTAASVHDAGKLYLPDGIVDKPGALTDAEFAVVKRHAELGAGMLSGLEDPELARIVRHHHERIDGAGYPAGLAGDEIPLGARIVAVADTFDAITSTRPYRSARRHRDALAVLAKEAGTQLDAAAVRAFRGYYSGLRPVALWSLALNGPRQLLATLGNELRLGNVAVTAQATAATAATVVAGSVAVHGPATGEREASPVTVAGPVFASSSLGEDDAEPQRSPDTPPTGGQRSPQSGGRPPLPPSAGSEQRPLVDPGTRESTSDTGQGSGGDEPQKPERETDGGGSGADSTDSSRSPTRAVAKELEPVRSTVDSVEATVSETVTNTVAATTEAVESVTEPVDSALPDVPLGRR
jgi:HD-GYP domain-containing protein (c-di-GMP phosphodiesterase class II)